MNKNESTFICEHCGCESDCSSGHIAVGQHICEICYHERLCTCTHCGATMWEEDDCSSNDDIILCRECYNYDYTTCHECGALICNDDAHYDNDDNAYCSECYDNLKEDVIHGYYFKPTPIFYGTGSRYFGVELEIDDGGHIASNAQQILDCANVSDEHIYIKSDGSLSDGMEIVTHPMTLDYHKNRMDWQAVTKKAIDLGYLSHKTTTCGLHVHVNRDSFSSDYDEQEKAIGNVLYLVERFWQELLNFSRRTQYQLERWASRYGYKEIPSDIYKHAKSTCADRYKCINILNINTIEFRIFRGTLKYNTIIATLQLVNELCKVASVMSEEELSSISWSSFVADINPAECPELIKSLTELYFDDISNRIKPTTLESKRYLFETKLIPFFGNMPVSKITSAHVRKWQNELINNEKGYAQTYLKTIHNQLSAVMNYAVRYYGLAKNPCHAAGSIGKKHACEMQIWTVEQFKAAMKYCPRDDIRIAFEIMFYAGLRVGEVLALSSNDILDTEAIDVNKSYALVQGNDYISSPKTPKSVRVVPIPHFLYEEIKQYISRLYDIHENDRIFNLGKSYLSRVIKRCAESAGLPKIRVHDLRHSHASLLLELGFNQLLISQRLGHENIETTMNIYAHLYPNRHEQVAGVLEKFGDSGKKPGNDDTV